MVRHRLGSSITGQAAGQHLFAFRAGALVIGALALSAGQAVCSGAAPKGNGMSANDSTYSRSVTFRVIGMKKTKSGAT